MRSLTQRPKAPRSDTLSCYAFALGSCAGRIEREHWLPQGVQEFMEEVLVSGFPWQAHGQQRQMAPGSYAVARVICQHHHRLLNGLDGPGRDYLRNIYLMSRTIEARREDLLVTRFDGRTIERWMLKAACGAVASGVGQVGATVRPEWVRALFGASPWPDAWRLFIEPTKRTLEEGDNRLKLSFAWAQDSRLLAVIFDGQRVRTGLELEPSDQTHRGMIFRPRRIGMRNTSAGGTAFETEMTFDWPAGPWVDPEPFVYPVGSRVEWRWGAS